MRLSPAAVLAVLVVGLVPGAASAQAPPPATYLEITDGLVSKAVSAAHSSGGGVTLVAFRGGQQVAGRSGRGRVVLRLDPMPGDTYGVSVGSTRVAEYQWDGTPVLGAACAGRAGFDGLRGSADNVIERAGAYVPGRTRYAPSTVLAGAVTMPTATTFSVALAQPMALGQIAYATARRELAGVLVRASSEANVVGPAACRDVTAPSARLLRIAPVRLRTLLVRGLRHRVRVSEAAVVSERLELVTPRRGARSAAVRTVGRARRSLARPTTATLTVRLTRAGTRAVRRAPRRSRFRLRTTVRDAAGNARRLPARAVTVRRR